MYCSNCKTIVIESKGEIFTPCNCNAPIIAYMEAKVIQKSDLE